MYILHSISTSRRIHFLSPALALGPYSKSSSYLWVVLSLSFLFQDWLLTSTIIQKSSTNQLLSIWLGFLVVAILPYLNSCFQSQARGCDSAWMMLSRLSSLKAYPYIQVTSSYPFPHCKLHPTEWITASTWTEPQQSTPALTKSPPRIQLSPILTTSNYLEPLIKNFQSQTIARNLFWGESKRSTSWKGEFISRFLQVIHSLVMCWHYTHSSQSLAVQWLLTLRKINIRHWKFTVAKKRLIHFLYFPGH